jgi:hypothetical protein
LTRAVNKSSRVARALYIQAHHGAEQRDVQDLAGASEDAFDAAVSAAVMMRARNEFKRLEHAHCDGFDDELEGRIWMPLPDPMFPHWPVGAQPSGLSAK